jgi:KDO2-lipid IV(A) lauroyltransferase
MIEACFYFILALPIAVLPFKLSIKCGEILGVIVFYIWSSRQKIAVENLQKAVDLEAVLISHSAEDTIKQTFKNYGRSMAEVIKIYFGLGRKLIESVEIQGIEHFTQAKAQGKGILCITGHCGNWELMGLTSSFKAENISVVARPINNFYLNRFVEKVRLKYGNKLIYKKGALKEIMAKLRDNKCVGVLMDQSVLADEGYVIDFLGRGAWTTKMPALIARKTEAAVIPVFIHRTDKGHCIKVHPAIKLSGSADKEQAVIEDTKKFSGFIEQYIKEHPTEWLWIHRRWKRK